MYSNSENCINLTVMLKQLKPSVLIENKLPLKSKKVQEQNMILFTFYMRVENFRNLRDIDF